MTAYIQYCDGKPTCTISMFPVSRCIYKKQWKVETPTEAKRMLYQREPCFMHHPLQVQNSGELA